MALSRPQTMQAAVLAELRRCINDGELRPGDVIRVDEEIYWLRALLEDQALRRALERATDDDRAAARDAFAAADRSLTRGDVNAFSEHARRFHTVILASCRMAADSSSSLP
jgi:DNA-binding GntR family transcriptional regulator